MNKLDSNVCFIISPLHKTPLFFTVDWSKVGGARVSNFRNAITESFTDLTYWLLEAVLTVMNQYMK